MTTTPTAIAWSEPGAEAMSVAWEGPGAAPSMTLTIQGPFEIGPVKQLPPAEYTVTAVTPAGDPDPRGYVANYNDSGVLYMAFSGSKLAVGRRGRPEVLLLCEYFKWSPPAQRGWRQRLYRWLADLSPELRGRPVDKFMDLIWRADLKAERAARRAAPKRR